MRSVMYSMESDTYSCDFCGFEMAWDGIDKTHGEMWGCEECGNAFCSKCFVDRFGRKTWMKMMKGSNNILCPTCYEEDLVS